MTFVGPVMLIADYPWPLREEKNSPERVIIEYDRSNMGL